MIRWGEDQPIASIQDLGGLPDQRAHVPADGRIARIGDGSASCRWPIGLGLVWVSAASFDSSELVSAQVSLPAEGDLSSPVRRTTQDDMTPESQGYAGLFSSGGSGRSDEPSMDPDEDAMGDATMFEEPEIQGAAVDDLGGGIPEQAAPSQPTPPVQPEHAGPWIFLPGMQPLAVDKPVVIGRRPVAPAHLGDDARLVYISAELRNISGTHAVIEPDGDGVVVTDLHSTNGTQVVWPDSPPERLIPGQRSRVRVGCVVDLGDGVALRLLATRPEGSSTSPQKPALG